MRRRSGPGEPLTAQTPWRMVQSDTNCSLVSKIPIIRVKYREPPLFGVFFPLHLVGKPASPLLFFRKFPNDRNREFKLGIREM